MAASRQKRHEWRDWFKQSRAYRTYRDSLIYDTVRRRGKVLKRAINLPRYLGNDYRCPVCGAGLRNFRPLWPSYWRSVEEFDPVHLPAAMETVNVEAFTCPSCDAKDRERLTWLYLDEVFRTAGAARRLRLIEFAPGDALPKRLRRIPCVAYSSADLTRRDVDDRIDLTAMTGCANDSVDIILCSHVLEHIPADRKAMSEIARVLKPDGLAIVLVPLVLGVDETHEDPAIDTNAQRWKYYGAGDHVRQYGKRDFIDRLEKAGLSVEQVGLDHFGGEAFQRAGLNPNSVLYIVRPR
jgi:SAM-dependent methyltransferase